MHNRRDGTRLPVLEIMTEGCETVRAHEAEIHGPSRLVYDPAGTDITLWIETDYPVKAIVWPA